MKKLSSLLLVIINITGICLLSSCGEVFEQMDRIYSGDFSYAYIKRVDTQISNKYGEYVCIYELSDEGKTKDTIILPEEIDDKQVIKIGMYGLGYSFSIFYGSSFTNLYISKYIESMPCHYLCGNKKMYIMDIDDLSFIYGRHCTFYLSESLYNRYIDEYADEKDDTRLCIANLEFISDNETYFIADYDDGDLITYVPEAPTKDGYEFGGWYKEEECINEWNFKEDTFILEEDETIIKLYAKWI